jgi:hypothetical protein
MALTVTVDKQASGSVGHLKKRVCDITFDSSYATAGESLTPADVGLRVVHEAIAHGVFRTSSGTTGVDVSYDRTNKKLFAYWGNAGSASVIPEVTSTTDLSTFSGRITFIGK